MHRFSTLFLLFILFFVFACSTPSWFPIKKGPPHKAKSKELVDKEVVIIDKEEYVKVANPRAPEGGGQPKYLYVPVNEYLSKKEASLPQAPRREEPKKGFSPPSAKPSVPLEEKKVVSVSPSVPSPPPYKKKVVIAHFDDQIIQPEEMLGDWVADKLIKEVDRRSNRILFVDYPMIKEFLEGKGIPIKDLETLNVLHQLNGIFSIQALVIGHLSGPYAFTTKGTKDQEGTASAIIKIEMRLIDTLSGRLLNTLTASNPILATKMRGSFSEERAKEKAIEVALADLGRSLARELDGLEWFGRVAKVEGDEVYLNAGKLTGIRVGDEMEILRPSARGDRGEVIGRIRISTCFGVDASIGRLLIGKRPDVEDILRMAKREGI